MKINAYSRWAMCMLLALLSACGHKDFGPDAPFGIIAQRYRFLPDAKEAQDQLKEMGISSTLMGYEIRGEGKWYGVFLGGSTSLEGMDEMKVEFEETFNLQNLERINYNQIAPSSFKMPDMPDETDLEDLKLPGALQELLGTLPYNGALQVASMQLYRTADSIDVFSLHPSKEHPLPFPRNVDPGLMMRSSTALAFISYSNAVSGKAMNFMALKLKKGHALGDNVAKTLTERVAGVQQDEMDQSEPVTANGYAGFIVTINPRADKVRHYIIALRPDTNVLIIGEADDRSFEMEAWRALTATVGDKKNATAYWHVGNALREVAEKEASQHLVYASFSFMEDSKASIGDRLKGNRKLRLAFYQNKKLWACEAMQFGHPADAAHVYEQMGKVKSRTLPDTFQIAGFPARLFYEKTAVVVKKKKEYTSQMQKLDFLAHSSIVSMNIPSGIDSLSQVQRMALQLNWREEE